MDGCRNLMWKVGKHSHIPSMIQRHLSNCCLAKWTIWDADVMNPQLPCPVCERLIKCLSPQKGDMVYEENYCSKYCRLYDEQNLKWVAYDTTCANHKGKLKWPSIPISCAMCNGEIHLLHDIEKSNRSYCSIDCWNKLKSSQKRGIHRTLNMLSLLQHRRKHHRDAWMAPADISERCGRKGQMCSPTSVGLTMKRWITSGIIESRLHGGSQHGHDYRFILKGLRGMTVAQFIYKWNTMSYAERIAFQQT